MVLYKLTNESTNETIDLYVVSDYNFDSEQSLIIYESPGANGGVVINAGRTNRNLAINGRIMNNSSVITMSESMAKKFVNTIIEKIMKWKEQGIILKVTSPYSDGSTQKYMIKKFHVTIGTDSIANASFNLNLEEYREANVKQTNVNLVNYGPTENLKKNLRMRATGR